MMHSISSENAHYDQYSPRSPVPLKLPQSSWSFLSECPAPPARRAGDFFGMETSNDSSNIYMPMLPSTMNPPSEWEDSPSLRPRLSYLSVEDTQDSSSCPSPAALDDESCSLSDESTDDSFADFASASEVRFEGLSLKDSTLWACPLPSMMNGDSTSVRLQPRSLSFRPNSEARGKCPLMPMEL
jgi:hypothetical protein